MKYEKSKLSIRKLKTGIKLWRRKNLRKEKIKTGIFDLLCIVFGCAIGAFATVAVMVPNGLTAGGLTGIVRICQKFIPVDFSVMYYIGAGIILVIVWIFLGFKEVRKIILLSVLYPTIIAIFEKINFQLLEEKDLILASVFCGVFMGVSNGIVFWRGYSFASTDAIAKILRKYLFPHVGLSSILLIIDACIIIASAFVFDRNIALYALISQVIATKVVDMVIYGFKTEIVQIEVITTNPEILSDYVLNEIERGMSSVEVHGEYTNSNYKKMITLCSPRESMLIKRFLAQNDPGAFVTVMRVDNVWGEGVGFGDIKKED